MRAPDLLLVALAVGGLIACSDIDSEADAVEAPDRAPPVSPATTAEPPAATPAFEAMDTGHVTGLVRLYPAGDFASDGGPARPFRMELVLDGLSRGEYRWHIRRGGCDASAPAGPYGEGTGRESTLSGSLVAPEDQAAQTAATVTALTLEEARSGEYTLHVAGPAGTTVACADLSGSDNATM